MRTLLGALLLGAFASCAALADLLPSDGEVSSAGSHCDADTPCSPMLRCIHHICSDDTTAFRQVMVSVMHDNTTQHFTHVDLSERPESDLSLSEELLVRGSVRTTAGKGIESEVVAQLDDNIAGKSVRRTSRTDADGLFSIQLTRGKVWSLRALPVGRDLPPSALVRVGGVQLDRQANTAEVLIVLPNHDAYWRVTGRLTGPNRAPFTTRSPIDDPGSPDTDPNRARLRLLDTQGNRWGLPIDTDATGSFSLLVRPETARITLLLEGGDAAKPALLLGEFSIVGADHSLGDIQLPFSLETSVVKLRARHPSDGQSVACTLRLRPLAAEGIVQFEAQTVEGQVTELVLGSGRYAVDFLPPEHSGLAPVLNVVLDTATIDENSLHASVELPRLVDVTGSLKLEDGLPAIGGMVTFEQRIGQPASDRPGAHGRLVISRSVAVDEDGSFTARMPAGRTSITAIPVTPNPRLVDERTIEHDVPIQLTAGRPVFFTGTVSGHDSPAGLPLAQIRVYSESLEVDGVKVMIGETITDAHGSFSVTLPTIQTDN
jgi:hypothetical protein